MTTGDAAGVAALLAAAVARATGAAVVGGRRVGGGDINEAWELRLRDGRRVFVKTRRDAPAGEYRAEAAGLAWLAVAGAVATAEVVAVDDPEGETEGPRFLALTWIEGPSGPSAAGLDPAGVEDLGRGLAVLHAAGAPCFGAAPPGTPTVPGGGSAPPLRLAGLTLPGDPRADWPNFYAECRMMPLVAAARRAGTLSGDAARAVERVCERLADLAGPVEPPARLHGDLWVGNVLGGRDGRARLIDPAAYGGHREIDLAMLALFGSAALLEPLLAAYQEVHPLAAGHDERVALWQLLPLLVHAVLFGGSYGGAVHAAARRYVG